MDKEIEYWKDKIREDMKREMCCICHASASFLRKELDDKVFCFNPRCLKLKDKSDG